MSDLVALVTGGGGGIGAATCRRLAADGYAVLVGYHRSAEAAAAVAETCGNGSEPIAVDVTDDAAVEAAVQRAAALGRLTVLVNNAGIADDDLLIRTTPDRFANTLDLDLVSAARCSRAALRPMLRARQGRIISVSSVVALRGNAGQTAYAAAKAGLIGFTRSLAREVASRNITVNAVAPGFVETAMTSGLPDDLRDELRKRAPIGRAVTADEVGAAIAFLASDAAAAITGAVLPVDGGAAM